MEDSMMSSINKAISLDEGRTDSPEESGWTEYFEDFMNENRDNTCCSDDFRTSSLVSDAASCAAWKFSDHKQNCKKLKIKKKRSRKILNDEDDLEDTASSPCNSPTVSELSQLHMNRRKRDDNLDTSQGKESKQIDERNELGFIGTENYCTELKKRGLCLVPISMLTNYLG
ncbi:vascular-related unknown protein 4-like isoform X2 [Telopea speciosissima]|uniref:vascular-related unknown protein 4-like isoform X2 n=1 Tax=Telopea speciosissima TaxID=54955 RepID=UPI001CC78354|nr:vascular-related unknown protein 4-like isoform X2 [Telopea speciosissima]